MKKKMLRTLLLATWSFTALTLGVFVFNGWMALILVAFSLMLMLLEAVEH